AQLRAAGVPDEVRGMIVSFGVALRAGYGEPLTDTVQRLTGRPARPIADLIERHRALLTGACPGAAARTRRTPSTRAGPGRADDRAEPITESSRMPGRA